MKKMIVGLTGASGSAYFLSLMDQLCLKDLSIHVVATETGAKVLTYETGCKLEDKVSVWNQASASITLEDPQDCFSKIASGSYRADAMAIVPCSMSTLGQIAHGITPNLLTRAADVMLKERRPLLIVPRETPLSSIHIQNMGRLCEAGAIIMPAMIAFYGHPKTVEDVVNFMTGKILDALGLDNDLYPRWEGNMHDRR